MKKIILLLFIIGIITLGELNYSNDINVVQASEDEILTGLETCSGYGCDNISHELLMDHNHFVNNDVLIYSGLGCSDSSESSSRQGGYSSSYLSAGCRNWQTIPLYVPFYRYYIDMSSLADLTENQRQTFIDTVRNAAEEWNSAIMHDGDGALIQLVETQPSSVYESGKNLCPVRYNPSLSVSGRFTPVINFYSIEIKNINDYSTVLHEFGHLLGLQDLDMQNDVPVHDALMGYGLGSEEMHYQDIQGLAVANGKHTNHDFRRYAVGSDGYVHFCFYCDIAAVENNPYSGSMHFEDAESCEHQYEKLVSVGNRHWIKCTKCYKVVESDFLAKGKNIDGNISIEITGLFDPNVTSISVPTQIGGQNITQIANGAFSNNLNLTEIIFENTYNITKIGNFAFKNCNSLINISTFYNLQEIGAEAFKGCNNLTNIFLPGSLSTIGDKAFSNCNKLNIQIASSNLNYSTANNILFDKQKTRLISACNIPSSVSIPSTVTLIEQYAFEGNHNLSSVYFLNNPTICSYAFDNCINLDSVYFDTYTAPPMYINSFICNNFTLFVPFVSQLLFEEAFSEFTSTIMSISIKVSYISNGDIVVIKNNFYGSLFESINIERIGYQFAGWYMDPTYTGIPLQHNELLNTKENITVYAKWNLISFPINYYNFPNNNEYSINNPNSYTIESSFVFINPTCTGYTFLGWYDNADFMGEAISEIVSGTIGEKSLYAKWEANTYIITLNPNASNASCTSYSDSVVFGSILSIEGTAIREGYSFDGWYTNSSCTGDMYVCGQSIWDIANNTTLYAKWVLERYEIQIELLDSNTGLSVLKWWNQDGISDYKVYLNFGVSISLYDFFRNYFATDGYREGYNCESFIADTEEFSNGDWETVPDLGNNEDKILVIPNWVLETHTINFSGGGGELSFNQTNGAFGTEIDYPSRSKVGYNFSHWVILSAPFINSDSSTLYPGNIFSESLYPDLSPKFYSTTCLGSGNITIEAQWIPKVSTIIFDSCGGSAYGPKEGVQYGDALTNMPIPTRIGYTFGGWYADEEYIGTVYQDTVIWDLDIPNNYAPTITLYAKWTPTIYSIIYDSNGGSGVSNRTYTIETPTFELPIITNTSTTLENIGWLNVNNNAIIYRIEQGTVGNLSLKALWHENESIALNQTKTITKRGAFMDFSTQSNVYRNSVYTFGSGVEYVVLKGSANKEFINLRFEIANRDNPITIMLWNFKFKAQNDSNAIYAKDADGGTLVNIDGVLGVEVKGDTELNLICKGVNSITGGMRTYYNLLNDMGDPTKYCSALICHRINISQDGNATLVIFGGRGQNGTTSNAVPADENEVRLKDGKPGGSAIWASYVYIDINMLQVYGGEGGNGAIGVSGTKGVNGTKSNTKGGKGGTGYKGGDGGDGRYAFNVARLISISTGSSVIAQGGSGGNGGKGGKGGTGGTGMDGAIFRAAGTGGDGGKGGIGGSSGGIGYAAKQSMATVIGNFTTITSGSNGNIGAPGDGGNAGLGGIKVTGGRAASGNPGEPGDAGV